MSSIVNKVKEVLHTDKDKTHTEGSHTTHATHGSSAAEPRIHTTQDTTTGLGGTSMNTREGNVGGVSDNYTLGAGANRGASGPASKTDGPHSSNLLNKADPRVDSDRDHSRNMGMNPQGTATTGTSGMVETTGTHHHAHTATGGIGSTGLGSQGMHTTTGGATGTAGPHSSNLMNKADPRVDSDLDGSRNMGMNPQGTTSAGVPGTHTGFQETGANRGFDGPATRTDGPHSSNLLNKADPRVDSDRDHSRNMGMNPQGSAATGTEADNRAFFAGGSNTDTTGMTGIHGTHGTHGSHGTHGAVGTGAFGTTGGAHDTFPSGTHATTGSGPGPAPHTAGPHQSDLLNKADPRVDSDLDGSKTLGGNKTNIPMAQRDPTDAAQVPPSVLQKHIGRPTVEHGDTTHDRERRHSTSHQEQHRGL